MVVWREGEVEERKVWMMDEGRDEREEKKLKKKKRRRFQLNWLVVEAWVEVREREGRERGWRIHSESMMMMISISKLSGSNF